MSWNYRVMRKKAKEAFYIYRISEVFYNDEGEPTSYTLDSLKLLDNMGSVETMEKVWGRVKKAFDKPVLMYEDSTFIEVDDVPPDPEDWDDGGGES